MNDLIVGVFCVDKLLNQAIIKYAEGRLEYGDENFEACKKEWNELKMKWEITIDSMMIIGKYFTTNEDFINIMKV